MWFSEGNMANPNHQFVRSFEIHTSQKKRKPQNEVSLSASIMILHGTQMMPVAKAGPRTKLLLDHANGIHVGWAV